MKNSITDVKAVEFVLENIQKITDVVGKTNLVFPAYKATKEELKKNYRSFAEAMARKNLVGYDQMTERNKKITEIYELTVAIQEIAKEFLQEIKNCKKKSFLATACIVV